MSKSLSENEILQNPRKHLKQAQQNALLAVDFFRHQKKLNFGNYQIGPRRYTRATVNSIVELGLARRSPAGLEPTMAGKIAVARLKGKTP